MNNRASCFLSNLHYRFSLSGSWCTIEQNCNTHGKPFILKASLDILESFVFKRILKAIDFLLIFLTVEEALFFDGICLNQIFIIDGIFEEESLIAEYELFALVSQSHSCFR